MTTLDDIYNFFDNPIPFTSITPVQLIMAVVLLVVGWKVAELIVEMVRKGMTKAKAPGLIIEFMASFLGVLLKVAVVMTFVGSLGFDMGPLVIGMSAAIGLILAFGLKDTFGNVAAGVWLASLHPFAVGDRVTINDQWGKVKGIGVMATELVTPDGILITIPNSLVWGEAIVNETGLGIRRVEVGVGIAYDADVDKAARIALRLLKEEPMVLDDPAPDVEFKELADSSVNLNLRGWVKSSDYLDADDVIVHDILLAYREHDIEIPFPQRVLHMVPEEQPEEKQEEAPKTPSKWADWDREEEPEPEHVAADTCIFCGSDEEINQKHLLYPDIEDQHPVTACEKCHNSQGDRDYEEWLGWLRKYKKWHWKRLVTFNEGREGEVADSVNELLSED